MRTYRGGRRGFTLIELIIVILVIGVLAAIAVPKIYGTRLRALRSTMQADLRNLATQQEVYYNDNFSYSNDLTALGFVESRAVTVTVNVASATGWSATSVHAGLTGEQCDTGHGSEGDGEIVCTVP
jgi:prepilin-type N-terminal cleavage/methylation domain-containing protein